ncbi:hypothetical protein FPOA_11616 [Fusarium poae]|uniref:Uncharacterized protein n=1 Tax=Fusarium poae TaxID=36050 RepID=A0A1B8AHF6_FUSPO|nr:hypothetical protein FPOA_11616 [Fusarium poae]
MPLAHLESNGRQILSTDALARQFNPLVGLVKRYISPRPKSQLQSSCRLSRHHKYLTLHDLPTMQLREKGTEMRPNYLAKAMNVRPARYLKEPAEQVPRIQTRRFCRRGQKALSTALSTTSTTRSHFAVNATETVESIRKFEENGRPARTEPGHGNYAAVRTDNHVPLISDRLAHIEMSSDDADKCKAMLDLAWHLGVVGAMSGGAEWPELLRDDDDDDDDWGELNQRIAVGLWLRINHNIQRNGGYNDR